MCVFIVAVGDERMIKVHYYHFCCWRHRIQLTSCNNGWHFHTHHFFPSCTRLPNYLCRNALAPPTPTPTPKPPTHRPTLFSDTADPSLPTDNNLGDKTPQGQTRSNRKYPATCKLPGLALQSIFAVHRRTSRITQRQRAAGDRGEGGGSGGGGEEGKGGEGLPGLGWGWGGGGVTRDP